MWVATKSAYSGVQEVNGSREQSKREMSSCGGESPAVPCGLALLSLHFPHLEAMDF